MRIAGIYLAAGQSSRMSVPKLILELAPGRPLGAIALKEMRACESIGDISVVVRPADAGGWLAEDGAPSGHGVRIVPCGDSPRGMSHSLRAGMKDAYRYRPDAVIVALADQPFVTKELFGRLIGEYVRHPGVDYVACQGMDAALPPVLFAPSMFGALGQLEGDTGARKLLSSVRYRGAFAEMPSNQMEFDIDTPFDLREARQRWKGWIERGGNDDERKSGDGNASNMQAFR
ncbi:NTP transferase domain-containing protein [Cohnella suwonensis]|uniref:NTP transferase domain-containing protein n=1 Tax=Cohnella suwonensis TaxID=696072 RepID=A0ABW0M3S2_9BACL